tara:strand:- start:518 stop:928 length:411 start_codon:yes stop_codon:yes gene_type:complete
MLIPLTVFLITREYLPCNDRETLNKYISISYPYLKDKYSKKDCKIIKFKYNRRLCCCDLHGNEDLLDAIKTLNKYNIDKDVSTIHFKTTQSLNFAKRFLYIYGKISHYCCGNKGVMFETNDEGKMENITGVYKLKL